MYIFYIQTLRAFRLTNPAGLEACRHGGLGQREVWVGKWVPRGWKIGPWASKMALGTSKSEPKWFPGGQNWSLEGPGTSKIGSWTVWKAVWKARGSPGRPSWGSKGRFGRHLGATWAPREPFRGRFWKILGVPNGSGKAIFWIQSGKVQTSKILCFLMCFP